MSEFSGSSASYPATITLLDDGDERDAAEYNDGLSDLADRTAHLNARTLPLKDGGTISPAGGITIDQSLTALTITADVITTPDANLSTADIDHLNATGILESTGFTPRFGLQNWSVCNPHTTGGLSMDAYAGFYSSSADVWLLAGGTDAIHISYDDGEVFQDISPSPGSGVHMRGIATGGTSSVIACGDSTTMYRCADIRASTAWSTTTAPGTPTDVRTVKYTSAFSRYVIVGEKTGPTPYAATSDNSTGSAWTDRSGGLPAGFAARGLGDMAIDSTGVVVAAAALAHTKLAVSTDGGISWADSTTTLSSGRYQLAWCSARSLFVAVRVDSTSANYVYTSSDGLTWTLRYSGALGFDSSPSSTRHHMVAWYGQAIVVAGDVSGRACVAFSLDLGATWELRRLGRGTGTANAGCIATNNTAGTRLIVSWGNLASRCLRRTA